MNLGMLDLKLSDMIKSMTLSEKNAQHAGVSELADEADSKSVDGNIVRVQVPPPA